VRPQTYTAAYLKVSSRRDAGGRCRQSTDSQRTALSSYCKGNSIRPTWYEDHATGRTTRRPALQRLLQDRRHGKVSRIVVADLNGLSRSVRDALSLIETLTAQGVALSVVNQNITFDRSAMSAFMLTVFSALAQVESDIRSERVKAGLQTGRDRGLSIRRQRAQQKRSKLATLRRQGTRVREIARTLGVTRQSVCRLLCA
jgi:DNA invertase Pin-like site-specific DNA recombinase